MSKPHNGSRRAPLQPRSPVGEAVSVLILLTAAVADALSIVRALTAVVDRRDGTAAGSILIGGKVHAGSNHGDPAREVRQSGLTTGSFVRSAGVLTGPALLSAPLHGCNQRTPREGYTHGANGVLQVPDGRRSWPPGPYLVPNWGRRDRPFQPLGLGGLRFPRTCPSCIHPIGLAWLSSTCGVQGSCVHLQLYERQVDNCLRKGRF